MLTALFFQIPRFIVSLIIDAHEVEEFIIRNLHFDPKPNHFARKNLFFPRLLSGGACVAVACDGNELGLPAEL